MASTEPVPGDVITTVQDLDALRARARNDRRATSTPLLVFGVVTAVGAIVAPDAFALAHFWYWAPAVLAGFAFLAWRRRRLFSSTGVGGGTDRYRWPALGFLLAVLLLFGMFIAATPLVALAVGLIVIAVRARNRYLGVCATIYGALALLELRFLAISNHIHDLDDAVTIAALGAFFVIAGLLALARETRRA